MRLDYGALSILLLCLHRADSFKHKTFRGFGKKMRQLDFSTADAEVFTSVAMRTSLVGLVSLLLMADARLVAKDTFNKMTTDDPMEKLDERIDVKSDALTKLMNVIDIKLGIYVITFRRRFQHSKVKSFLSYFLDL